MPCLSIDLPYFAGFLRRWGVRFEALVQGEFKSGYAALSDRSASRAHLRSARSLLRSSYDQLIRGIAKGRGVSERDVKS